MSSSQNADLRKARPDVFGFGSCHRTDGGTQLYDRAPNAGTVVLWTLPSASKHRATLAGHMTDSHAHELEAGSCSCSVLRPASAMSIILRPRLGCAFR